MLKLAAESGTTDIVATPHADLQYAFQPQLVRERVAELEAAVDGKPRIYEGCDFHLTYDNIQDALANPAKYTINHKNYLLVEFSHMLIFQNSAEIFARLRGAGIIPVITHPERNALLQQRLPHLERWVQQGCCLQITAQSVLGRFGKTARQFSIELLENRIVHFIASDAHDTLHRPPVLREACAWVAEQYGDAMASSLFVDNPHAVLAGAPLAPWDSSSGKPRKWYQFWRS